LSSESWALEGGRGLRPLDLENFSKKVVVFLVSGEKKTNFSTFGPPKKNFGKIPGGSPWKKILPTSMLGAVKESVSLSLQ